MAVVRFNTGEVSFHSVVKVEVCEPVYLGKGYYTSLIVTENDGTENEVTFHHDGPELPVVPKENI